MKFGMPEIDERIKLATPACFVVVGAPGSGKKPLARKFISSLGEGEQGVYITTDRPVEEIQKEVGKAVAEKITFIDCHSWTLGIKEGGEYFVPGPFALNELGVIINKLRNKLSHEGAKVKLVIDSLSTFFLYANPEKIFKFIQVVSAKLKASNFYSLYLIEAGMHDPTIMTTLEHLTDGTITFMIDNFGKHRVRFSRFIESDWIELPKLY